MINSDDLKLYLSSIGAIEENSLFTDITAEQSFIISGGNVMTTTRPRMITTLPSSVPPSPVSLSDTTISFDISSYMFALGASVVFNRNFNR